MLAVKDHNGERRHALCEQFIPGPPKERALLGSGGKKAGGGRQTISKREAGESLPDIRHVIPDELVECDPDGRELRETIGGVGQAAQAKIDRGRVWQNRV